LNKILLVGIQKSGNSWVRFVIFNYFNILNNRATKTLTWDELQKPHLDRLEKGVDYEYNDGFPLVFHTHLSYDGHGIFDFYSETPKYFAKFDKIIYIYRNPFDTMISYWHFMMDRNGDPFGDGIVGEELDKLRKLEGFVEFYLPKWIYHVKTTRNLADLILDYDQLRKNPNLFAKAITLIDNGMIHIKNFNEALEMSSFSSIKRMSEEVGNIGGLGSPYYKGYFCRDGRSGQYKEVMSQELINYIRNECLKEGIEV
jgi:hypothetical protein